jgi:hypothetical protein
MRFGIVGKLPTWRARTHGGHLGFHMDGKPIEQGGNVRPTRRSSRYGAAPNRSIRASVNPVRLGVPRGVLGAIGCRDARRSDYPQSTLRLYLVHLFKGTQKFFSQALCVDWIWRYLGTEYQGCADFYEIVPSHNFTCRESFGSVIRSAHASARPCPCR